MSKLRISPDLSLPPEVVTSTEVVYGGKGMGKTNLGSVLVEEMTKADLRWSVLDPMGVWWGLRHSPDGKGPGIECLILGGAHGDIPIEPTAGAIVADLVIDERVNTIVDFSRKSSGLMWSKGERIRFVTDYATRLFERQGSLVGGRRREPIHQILDEAARYIPQIIPSGAQDLAKCVGAWEQIVEEGRNIGLGVTFLTQRSARMNKSVSELADVMYAFRTIGPNSLEAVMDWLGEHVEKARVRDLASKVRELNVGQALVVSPGWLRVEKIAQIRERETFDSSATPKPGQQPKRVTGKAATPDLAAYQLLMAETIEKAKQEDPKALRAEVAALKRQLAGAALMQPAPKPVVDERAVARAVAAAVKPYQTKLALIQQRLFPLTKALGSTVEKLEAVVAETSNDEDSRAEHAGRSPEQGTGANRPSSTTDVQQSRQHAEAVRHLTPVVERASSFADRDGSYEVSASEQKILDAIAFMTGIGSPTKKQNVAFFSGYAVAGRFNNLLGGLRSKGLIDYPQPHVVKLTNRGKAVARAEAADIRSLDDLHDLWLRKLEPSQAKILRAVLSNGRHASTKEQLAKDTDYEIAGRFNNLLGGLRSLGAIDYPQPGHVAAGEALFPEGLI